ncbi:MAG: hypothetical protein L3J46_07275 [Kangiellaceae bacterium]|nr:hypothetical protein [Kangiellaceae bacterium]
MQKYLKEHSKISIIAIAIIISAAASFLFSDVRNIAYDKFFPAANNLSICKTGMYYRADIFNKIKAELKKDNGILDSYFAAKGLSKNGLSYLLLVNYESTSKLITYLATGGLKTSSLSKDEGEKLFSSLATLDYKQAKGHYGGASFHADCDFIRITDSFNQYDFEILNASSNEGNPAIKILMNVDSFLKSQYASEKAEVTPSLPKELDDSELTRFEKLIDEDTFFELSRLK